MQQSTGAKRVKIEPKKDNLKIEMNARGFYSDRLNLGVDVGAIRGRTQVEGGYYYGMVDKEWKP